MKSPKIFACLTFLTIGALKAFSQENSIRDYDVEHAWSTKELAMTAGWVWPQYRGLHGDGVASDNATPPVSWGESSNLVWKTPLPGRAWSSPIVWKDRIWLTDADEDGKEQRLVAIDRESGRIVFNEVLFRNESVQPDYHITNSYASSTPVTDGKLVYCHFGAYGTAAVAIDRTGEPSIVWKRRDLACNHYRGPGSSPILFNDMLIMHFDGFDQQYVVALDKHTGTTVWKSDRDIDFKTDNGDMHKAFATPEIIDVDGSVQLISPAAKAVESYDPMTGKRLWFLNYEEHSNATRPMFDGNLVYMSTGFSKAKMIAIDPRGKGDVTGSHVRWTATKSIGCKPSAIYHEGKIYNVEDRGVFTSMDAKSGEILWQKRLGGDFSASPILANGNIYAFDEMGKGYTIATAGEGEILAENQLDAGCMASPVAVNDCLIVRTTAAVYCFRNQ